MTDRLSSFLVAGLSAGSLYALVALGLVLVHRSTRVLNFAHGELATLGTFVAFELASRGHSFAAALAGGALASAAVAVAFFSAVLVPAQRRGASPLGLLILTLGLAQVLHGFVLWRWRAEPERFPFPIAETASRRLGPVVVSELSLASLAVGLLGAFLLYVVVQHTRFGLALRALSENPSAAQTLGIPTRPLLAAAWALAAGLAVVAGVFLAAQVLLDPFFMLDPFLKGFAAATLGGLNSLPGALAGGLLLGAAEAATGAALGLEFKNSLAFVVIVLVLLVRPEGLLGRKLEERV
jgi:branched-chain amino acid transport system permease protein